jgi:SAM-dependent methyltransferase
MANVLKEEKKQQIIALGRLGWSLRKIQETTRVRRETISAYLRGAGDVGCGNGIPITRALLSEGHRVIGLDSSGAMLAHFKQNCPEAFAVRGIVESCPFADGLFDAAVAWGVMFHLNPEDAVRAIANVSRILKRDAPFLFTSGDEDAFDAKEGKMNEVTFRYFSYSPQSYRRILGDHSFTLVDVHADSGNNTYYLAKKADPMKQC